MEENQENKVNIENNKIEKEPQVKKKRKNNSAKRTIIVLIFAIVCILITFIFYRGNYLQVLEIGKEYINSFKSDVKYKFLTIIVSFLWMYILMYTTNKRIRNGLKVFFEEEKKDIPKFPNKSISFIVSAITSVIASKILLQKVILFLNRTSFGKSDFIYGHDMGYYLFTQPFLQSMIIFMLITFSIVTLYAVIYYIILINTQFSAGINSETFKNSALKKQLLNNMKVIVVLIAMLTFVNAENLSSQSFITVGESGNSYSLIGAGQTEISVKVWGYRGLSLLMIIAIFMAIPAYYKQKNRRLFICIASVPLYLILLILVLVGYNKIFINSNEYEKEKTYISYNIENTRAAYGINIDETQVVDSGTITNEEMNQYNEVVNNINTNNNEQILNLLNNTLTNKGQYKYTSTSVGLYNINDKNTLVYITPREITSTENAYTNSTYENTHGYGVIVTSASKTDVNGNPVNLQKDFTSNNAINVVNPRIYFGLETNKTIVTNAKNNNEFDYPIDSSKSATNSYDGNAGLYLNSFDKLVLAVSKGDVNLAFTANLNENSKILTNRNVLERAKKILPYIKYDDSPYLVITKSGKLVWVIDGYTTSNYYPYSQKSNVDGQEINYIKNSVKVLIDAYDGDISFYITDRTDPIIMAYQKAFPDVFKGIDEKIPEEISEHFTYSEFLYNIQSEILKRYHNTETDVIYRANDIWDIAKYGKGANSLTTETTQMEPYYSLVKTSDNAENTLGLVLPYTIYGKQSLTAYVIGSYENGAMKLKLYRYSSDNSMIGPIQIDTQIGQNEEISKEIESLNVSGTKITKNIALIPINNKMIYVESIYQEYLNENNSLPILKKVVVISGNKIASGDDIEKALKNLISQSYNIEVENYENKDDLIKSIIKANKNLKESTSNRDYEIIGKDINRLQSLIDELEKIEQKEEQDKIKQDKSKIEDKTTNSIKSESI